MEMWDIPHYLIHDLVLFEGQYLCHPHLRLAWINERHVQILMDNDVHLLLLLEPLILRLIQRMAQSEFIQVEYIVLMVQYQLDRQELLLVVPEHIYLEHLELAMH